MSEYPGFESIYSQVSGIVNRSRQKYYIQLWEYDDWHQEGRIILYQLLKRQPGLEEDFPRLLIYFKTKFTNHVKDVIRGQESQKRRFNRMVYEEISEVAHLVPKIKIEVDEEVALRDIFDRFASTLDWEELILFKRLICGDRFKGRKIIQEKLSRYMHEFREG